jgi:hypothetical protein
MVTVGELLQRLDRAIAPVVVTPSGARTPIARVVLPDPDDALVVIIFKLGLTAAICPPWHGR